jgi:hypothetical protein
MKTTRFTIWVGLVVVLMTPVVRAQLDLPYYDRYSGTAEQYAFKISNTNAGSGVTYGGFFYTKSGQGRGVFGQAAGTSGIGVKGWASVDGNVENFGGHFCTTGQRGIGVYGWAENTGNVVNYGGKFLAEGRRGIGIHAKGGTNGQAGVFDGDVKILGSGKGIIFPDGSKLTTASGSGSSTSSGGPVTAETSIDEGNAIYGKATGLAGIAVHGVAEYDATSIPRTADNNYGGYFIADGPPKMFDAIFNRTGIGIYAKGSLYAADLDGDVKITGDVSTTENARIGGDVITEGDVRVHGGNIRIANTDGHLIIELGEGLDYAEGFDVVDKVETSPGTVLVIDPENPGQLKISGSPYDTRVAGIAAGAKGLGSGVRLGSEQFDCDVALAGRVYCNVDAAEEAVKPGDLLTTSAIPGYAMKVSDYTRSQGAVLGKAMETLEKGKKGQILVLVTLQ